MSSCLKKTNAARQKSVQIRRAIFAQQKSESLNPNGKNHFNLCNLWEINNKIPCVPCIPWAKKMFDGE